MTNATTLRTDDAPRTPAGSPASPSERDVLAALAAGPHRRLDVGHSKLAYWRFGRGPDVVFVHGWPLHAATFRRIVPALARDFTCHLIDLPFVGRTESKPGAPVGLREHADTVRAAVDALGLTRYAFVAHDSGGVFTRLVAADDARVVGQVLGNTEIPGHVPPMLKVYAIAARLPGGSSLLRSSMHLGPMRRSVLGFGGCFTDPWSVEGEFGDLFVRPMLTSPAVMAGQSKLLNHLDFRVVGRLPEVHARTRSPALLVWGADDPWFPLAKARAMLPQFGGGAEIREIAGGKLFAHEDHPEAFVAHARPFLLDCFASASGPKAVA
ncbi:MAG TPA: alpha/beta hydrolase [Polyangiaceae bacterium]|nr:alpha/beta hydrolase [Polyangiaceae bacterium]